MSGLIPALRLLHSLNDRVNYRAIFWWPTNIFPAPSYLRGMFRERTGTEEERGGGERCQRRTPWRLIHSFWQWTAQDRFGKCLKWVWFVQSGLVFGRSAAGMRPGVEGGVRYTDLPRWLTGGAGGQRHNSVSEWRAAHPESQACILSRADSASICGNLYAQYVTYCSLINICICSPDVPSARTVRTTEVHRWFRQNKHTSAHWISIKIQKEPENCIVIL